MQPESKSLSSKGKANYIAVQLVLSTDGLRLLWTPEPGAGNTTPGAAPASGFVRTTDIRAVTYDGSQPQQTVDADEEARSLSTRFAIVTPFETLYFASTLGPAPYK